MRAKISTQISAAVFLTTLFYVSNGVADCFCQGCGCKGGPGWRDNEGHCVSYKKLLKTCGDPPDTKCTYEGAKQVCASERRETPSR
jgi:hypothetical protein